MKIVPIHYGGPKPHPINEAWIRSVTNIQSTSFTPTKLKIFRDLGPWISHPLAWLKSLYIPNADIYLVTGIGCVAAVLFKWKKKIISINSDTFFYDYGRSRGLKRKIYEKYLGCVDGLISTSKYMKKLAQKYTKIPNKLVYPGINKKFFKINSNLNSINIAHGLSGLRKDKGTDLIIEAFLKLRGSGKLYLIGPVAENMEVLEKNKSNKKIIISGWTDSPEKYLKNCGIYVNPARHEPFGMNIIEAMAAGIPPIVSENCGAKEIVEKVSKKLIIKPNVPEIIKAINWLNKGNRKEILGKKAKKIAMNYTEDKSVANFRKAFYEIVKEVKKK